MTNLEDLMFLFARGVGHTYTELNGIKNNPKAILIVANEKQKENINLPKNQMVSIDSLPNSLIGKHQPMVIDHYALHILVEEMKKHYELLLRKEAQNDKT